MLLVIARLLVRGSTSSSKSPDAQSKRFDSAAASGYGCCLMIARLLAALLVVTLCAAASAAEPRLLTPHDLWAIKRVGSPALSPDGKFAVFPVQQWNVEKNKSSSNLWTVALASGEVRQLTTAAETTEDAPMWSPDGTRIAFTSKRGEDENATLYVIPFAGGEAEKIIDLPSAIAAPKWLGDGKSIVFATTVIPE